MRYTYKLSAATKNTVEYALRNRDEYVQELRELKLDLIPSATRPLSPTPGGQSGTSRPVENVVIKTMYNNRVQFLENAISAVDFALQEILSRFVSYLDIEKPKTQKVPMLIDEAPAEAVAARNLWYILQRCYITEALPLETACVILGIAKSTAYSMINEPFYIIAAHMGMIRYENKEGLEKEAG